MNFQDVTRFLTKVTKGKAVVIPDGLRCRAPRDKEPDKPCNKKIAKKNILGQIAGNFKCERCGQEVEVESIPRT